MRVIGGSARGRKLKTRKGTETRPTGDRVKESLFNILQPRLPGALMLDTFAGTGSIGIEALSRGAEKCIFIEKCHQCVTIIKENLALCGLSRAGEILHSEALSALNVLGRHSRKFDLIFLDPPYHSTVLAPALTAIADNGLVAKGGIVVVEHLATGEDWWQTTLWQLIRQKEYGDTVITFLVSAK